MNTQTNQNKAFTLIELLVVIAIIALLLSIIMPSLRAVKELASGVVCTNNQKSLAAGWILYAEDNDSGMIGGSTYYSGNRATPYRWVEPPLLQPVYQGPIAGQAALSQETRENGIRAGKLFTYMKSVDVYHCPGDNTFTKAEPYAVYRSYAITGLMNGEHFRSRPGGQFEPITEYRKVDLGNGQKDLVVAEKVTEVRSPGTKLVFMEEDVVVQKEFPVDRRQEYNKGSWVLLNAESGGYSWWDAPAGYHNEGCTFSYADGHAERRKWQDDDTLAKIRADGSYNETQAEMQNNEDLIWLAKGYIPIP